MAHRLLLKPKNKGIIALGITATAITGGITVYAISQFGQVGRTASTEIPTAPIVQKVTALGRLQPEAEVIKLSAPLALDGDRIAQILVEEGDRVKAGQVIAVLDSRDRLQTAVLQAQKQVQVAQ